MTDPPRPETDPTSDVHWWGQVTMLHALIEHDLSSVLRRQGVGLSEYRALALLAGTIERELRILDLADALGLNQSSVSRLVARLESAGLVRREACGDDRRGVFTVITDAGLTLHERLAPTYQTALAEALQRAVAKDPALQHITEGIRQASADHPNQD